MGSTQDNRLLNKYKMTKRKKRTKALSPYYKSYDMKWLKSESSHPDHHLVAEYEEKNGVII